MAAKKTFAERLVALREKAGLTPTQLAEAADLGRMEVWRLENGVRRPMWDTVVKLAKALGVSTDDFLMLQL